MQTKDDFQSIDQLIENFEQSVNYDENGNEYWTARKLQTLLGYSNWQNFEVVIDKAKIACENSNQKSSFHFIEVFTDVNKNPLGGRPATDYNLGRYACYLIAQNGDARKKQIAFAQTYFAIQTRRQEVNDKNHTLASEEQKRLLLREEISFHLKNLASAAKNAGVREPLDFAIFQNFGYKGLYGGLDKNGIQKIKGLEKKQNILDYMGSTELAANLFRATQTEDKLQREKIKGKNAANNAHLEVGKKVRQAIKDIGGTMPEKLPVAEDIKKIERRVTKILTKSGVKS